jgi:peptide/nickel transport system substrate-binding protein
VTGLARVALTIFAGAGLAFGVVVTASAETHAAPKYGGTLVVGQIRFSAPDTLDPTLSRSASSVEIYKAICERLYEYDARYRLIPLLAAAPPVLSKDKLSYTVQLRKGIQFNDGTPFNAQAVVTTVQRNMTDPGSVRATDYAPLESVTASGQYTVLFRLKARNSAFTANPQVVSPAQLAKAGANFGADPVCVGPFMFDDRVAGDHVTVIKSPYYYDQKDVFLDKIVFKTLSGQPAAAAALKAGDVQALDGVGTPDLAGVRQTSSLRVLEGRPIGWSSLFLNIGNKNGAGVLPYANVGTPLASSPKQRQAFEEAIDRNTLNRVVFDGLYQPSCTLIAAANTAWYEATKVPCTPYDPKHARKLVAESGFTNPTVHLLVAASSDAQVRLAQFIQAQEAAVGINVVIDATDAATALARSAAGDFDTYFLGQLTSNPDPNDVINRFLLTPGLSNRSGYSSPRLDLILNNAVKATDLKARSTLYHAAQQIIGTDRPMIVLYNQTVFVAFNTSLTGVRLAPDGNLLVANARYK